MRILSIISCDRPTANTIIMVKYRVSSETSFVSYFAKHETKQVSCFAKQTSCFAKFRLEAKQAVSHVSLFFRRNETARFACFVNFFSLKCLTLRKSSFICTKMFLYVRKNGFFPDSAGFQLNFHSTFIYCSVIYCKCPGSVFGPLNPDTYIFCLDPHLFFAHYVVFRM
jgi:hypothetical protein